MLLTCKGSSICGILSVNTKEGDGLLSKYLTVSGDVWDKIAYKVWKDTSFTPELMEANAAKLGTFIFRAGVELEIPDVSRETKAKKPPWR